MMTTICLKCFIGWLDSPAMKFCTSCAIQEARMVPVREERAGVLVQAYLACNPGDFSPQDMAQLRDSAFKSVSKADDLWNWYGAGRWIAEYGIPDLHHQRNG